jgi:hypothetical protein
LIFPISASYRIPRGCLSCAGEIGNIVSDFPAFLRRLASINNVVYRLCRIVDIINNICSICNSTCGLCDLSDTGNKRNEVNNIADQSGLGPGVRRILDDIRNTEAQRNDIKNRIPELAIGIGAVYRIISAVGKGVVAKVALAGRGVAVRIDEAADLRVVIPGLEIVESCLGIVVIAAILQGIDRRHFAGCGSGFIRDHHSIVHRASQMHWTHRAYKTVHVQQKSRRS